MLDGIDQLRRAFAEARSSVNDVYRDGFVLVPKLEGSLCKLGWRL
jgi:hypothetical protein